MDQLDAALLAIPGAKHHFNALLVLLTSTATGATLLTFVLFAILTMISTLSLQLLLDAAYLKTLGV